MKVTAEKFDIKELDQAIDVVRGIADHRRADPSSRIDPLYYDLVVKLLTEVRDAVAEGKPIIAVGPYCPALLILRGFDVLVCPGSPTRLAPLIIGNRLEESLAVAGEFGISPEVCSGQRAGVGATLRGWAPRPEAFVGHIFCDGQHKLTELNGEMFECPSFFIDRPYSYGEGDLQYFRRQLEEMVEFMERLTGQKIDWDKVRAAIKCADRMHELQDEIMELRKAVPSPMKNRGSMYLHVMGMGVAGRPEGIEFYQAVRDEIKERVEQHRGYVAEERLRLLVYYEPPQWSWKLLDWMEREHGAIIVAEPCHATGYHGKLEMRIDDPLDAIMRWTIIHPLCWQSNGPVENAINDIVRATKEYQADGVIMFANLACVAMGGTRRILKDAISEESGIPCCTVEFDMMDPASKGMDKIKEDLEIFFEMLEERKEAS